MEFVEEFHPAFCPVAILFSPSPESFTLYLPVKHPILSHPHYQQIEGAHAAKRTAAFPVDEEKTERNSPAVQYVGKEGVKLAAAGGSLVV